MADQTTTRKETTMALKPKIPRVKLPRLPRVKTGRVKGIKLPKIPKVKTIKPRLGRTKKIY